MVHIRFSAYADEGNLLSESVHAIKKNTEALLAIVRDWCRSKG